MNERTGWQIRAADSRVGKGSSCLGLSLLVLKVTVLVRERPGCHANSVHLELLQSKV